MAAPRASALMMRTYIAASMARLPAARRCASAIARGAGSGFDGELDARSQRWHSLVSRLDEHGPGAARRQNAAPERIAASASLRPPAAAGLRHQERQLAGAARVIGREDLLADPLRQRRRATREPACAGEILDADSRSRAQPTGRNGFRPRTWHGRVSGKYQIWRRAPGGARPGHSLCEG